MENNNGTLPQLDLQTIQRDQSEVPTSSEHVLYTALKRRREGESEDNFPELKSLRLEIEKKDWPESTLKAVKSAPSCNLNSLKQVSDKNCKKSCGLQYGISHLFGQTVVEQQKVKASKSHIKPQTFDNPNDQNYYKHMLEDVMVKNVCHWRWAKDFQEIIGRDEDQLSENPRGTRKEYVLLSIFV